MAQVTMTTKEIDEIFYGLQGVEQFVVGNIALDRHRKFFLNLADGEKLSILNERGHVFPAVQAAAGGSLPLAGPREPVSLVRRNGKDIPKIIDLLMDVRRCRKWGFVPGHPVRDALQDLIKLEVPALKDRVAARKQARIEKKRKPVQMRLW